MICRTILIPVVPARGGAEVALRIYKTFHIYRTCMCRAPARPVCARCVRVCCTVAVQEHDLRATTLQCNAERRFSFAPVKLVHASSFCACVAVLPSRNMTCVRPPCTARPREDFLPKRSPCNIHAAITMRLATPPASLDAHGNTTWQHACCHSTAICNPRFQITL